jgi:choline kinase
MNIFVLSAGIGSRLYPLTKNTPKSILDLGDGTTLAERLLSAASHASHKIDSVYFITGYRSEQIEAKIKEYPTDLTVKTIYNPFYRETNNLVSVWCSQPYIKEKDFIISNGDNIYSEDLVTKVLSQVDEEEGFFLLTSTAEAYDDDTMKVTFDKKGNVQFVSKKIEMDKVQAESIGFFMVRGEKYRHIFQKKVSEIVRDPEYLNRFWLEIINSLINDGVMIQPLEVSGNDWSEMDFHPDMNVIKDNIKNRLI